MDSAEKLVAGGPYSVRAYAVGALTGDTGYLGNFEYRHEVGEAAGRWQGFAFLDSEHLEINRDAWSVGANHATLSGAGLGLSWSGSHQWFAKAYIAAPIGATPGLIGATYSARVGAEIDKGF